MIVRRAAREALSPLASGITILSLICVNQQAVASDDFTIVIFGDTQRQVQHIDNDAPDPNTLDPNDPNNFLFPDAYDAFKETVDWLVDANNPEPIALVLHVGDATERGSHDPNPTNPTNATLFEWRVFAEQWEKLESEFPALVARGNHDNKAEFAERYGDPNSPSPADASAIEVTLAGQEVVVILGLPCNPTAGQIDWAEGLLDDDPNRPAILVSHIITDPNSCHQDSPPTLPPYDFIDGPGCPKTTDPNNPPNNLWDDLVEPYSDQIFLAASGHFTRVCRILDDDVCEKWDESVGMGFKKLREVTKGSVDYHVLDTMQNWQRVHKNDPNASAAVPGSGKGFVTLVRFLNQRGAGPSVEVLAVDPSQMDANNPNPVEDERDGITSLSKKWFHFAFNKVDVDGDGDDNPDDNCPFTHQDSTQKTDTNGDGIGNRCQCGDVTGGGNLTSSDVTKVVNALTNGDYPEQATDRWDLSNVSDSAEPNDPDTTFPRFVLSYADQKALSDHVIDPNNNPVEDLQRCLPAVPKALTAADSDDDGIPDPNDNCVGYENPQQADTAANGRGDVCTCGDVDGSGSFERCLASGYKTDPNAPDFCEADPAEEDCDDVWMCEQFNTNGPPYPWEQDGPCDTDNSDTCTWTDYFRVTGTTDPNTFTCEGHTQ
jgi:hypothetical protein